MQYPRSQAPNLSVLLAFGALSACTPPRFATGDAGASDAQSTRQCAADNPDTFGQDCPHAVICLNAGNCDVSQSTCCIDISGLNDTCNADAGACGVNRYRVACDGPEDCGNGQACCLDGLSALCISGSCATEDARICHTDADCTTAHCVQGHDDFTYRAWGFCRG